MTTLCPKNYMSLQLKCKIVFVANMNIISCNVFLNKWSIPGILRNESMLKATFNHGTKIFSQIIINYILYIISTKKTYLYNKMSQHSQINVGPQCTLTVQSLRSKGASKRGHIATINLIQFPIQRKLDSLNADPGIRKTKQPTVGFDYHHAFISEASILPKTLTDLFVNHVTFIEFHVTKPSAL